MSTYVKAIMTIESDNTEELKRILDHHIDYMIDMDDNRDIIRSISGVSSYETSSKNDRTKLIMIAEIIDDILSHGVPSEEDLDFDDDKIAVYSDIQRLKESLSALGLGE